MTNAKLYSVFERVWLAMTLFIVGIAIHKVREALNGNSLTITMAASCFVLGAYWLRFFFGNLNYLHDTYATGRRTPLRLAVRAVMDIILLVLHMSALSFMAAALAEPTRFVDAVVFLNVTDCWWLFYELRCWPSTCQTAWMALRGQPVPAARRVAARTYSPRQWTWTNLACAAVIIGLRQTMSAEDCTLLFVLTAAASVIASMWDVMITSLMFRPAR